MRNVSVDLSQAVVLLEEVPTPVWIARDGNIVYANSAARRLCGTADDQEGRIEVQAKQDQLVTLSVVSASGIHIRATAKATEIQLLDGPAIQYSVQAGGDSTLSQARLDFTLAELLGGVASWEWDLETEKVYWSAGHYTLLGLSPNLVQPAYEIWRQVVHPDDISQAESIVNEALANRKDYLLEYRVCLPDGSVRWLESRGRYRGSQNLSHQRFVGVSVDITERKLAERAIREGQERLQAALDAAVTGTFRWDVRTNELSWDSNLDRLFGIPEGSAVKDLNRFISLVHPDDQQGVIDRCQASATTGVDFDMEYRVIWPDGSVHWLYDRGQIFRGEDGAPSYMTGACVDITERKLADLELRLGEERLRLALQSAAAGTFDWDIVNNINQWSPEIETIYGFVPGTFPGTFQDWEKCVHPDDLPSALASLQQSLETGEFSSEWRIFRRDTGECRWIAARAKVLKDENGHPMRMIGMNTDITEKKAADLMIRRGAQILDQIHDAVIATDLGGRITLWNNGAVKRFGYTAEEVLGKHVSLLYFQEDHTVLLADAIQHVQMKGVHEVEVRNRRKDGSEFFGHLSLSLLSDENGSPIGMIGYTMDLTEKKRAERVLRASEKIAATGRLASTLAHEINNPLEALTNIIFLLRHYDAPREEVERSLRMAEMELSRISSITRHLLSFHRQPVHPVEVDIPSILDETVEIYRSKLEGKRISLVKRYKKNAPAVRAYSGELRQVYANILNNAIEACPENGRIVIGLSAVRGERGGVRVIIGDTGRGIRKEEQSKIFEPFYTTKGDKGTGLGLWVSKDLVLKHGGRIAVRSNTRGTCFAITIPLGQAIRQLGRAV